MAARKVDRIWFDRKLEEKFGSARSLNQLAALMTKSKGTPMDGPRLTRILSGIQEPTIHESIQLAKILVAPIAEIIRRFGYKA